jgi:hypothetical protein
LPKVIQKKKKQNKNVVVQRWPGLKVLLAIAAALLVSQQCRELQRSQPSLQQRVATRCRLAAAASCKALPTRRSRSCNVAPLPAIAAAAVELYTFDVGLSFDFRRTFVERPSDFRPTFVGRPCNFRPSNFRPTSGLRHC